VTWPHLILWCAAALGIMFAVKNPTSGALAVNWLIGEIVWMVTGNNLPLGVYFCADVGVLAVICSKAVVREGCRTYPTLKEQIHCFRGSLTLWDKLVAGGYILAAWPLYVITLDAYYKWWVLYAVLLLQYIFSGGEIVFNLLGDRRVSMSKPPRGSGLAYARFEGRV